MDEAQANGSPPSTSPSSKSAMRASRKSRLSEAHPYHAGAAEALRLSAAGQGKEYGDSNLDIVRNWTVVEEQVIEKEVDAELIVEALPKEPTTQSSKVDLYLPEILEGAVFVGHLVTDLDSIGGAIGAAALYGGTAAAASPVNSETQFALDYWKVDTPPPVEEVLKERPNADVCLVDHQQTSQMNPAISADQIVGVIDHHALQSKTIVTDMPIYIDIRPWGSMSTIVTHTFLTHNRRPTVPVAGMMLCAILSDTLNLMGPTTTDWDRLMVAVLAEIAGVEDIQLLATQQFKAKSKELASLSAVSLVNGDQKIFSFNISDGFRGDIGFAVVETTDDEAMLNRIDELLPEMAACKKEKDLSMLFLAVVNIVNLESHLLLCGSSEMALAVEAYGGNPIQNGTLLHLGSRVSRKKDFVPAMTRVIKGGWTQTKAIGRGSYVDLSELGRLMVDPNDPFAKVRRVGSVMSRCSLSSQLGEGAEEVVVS